MYIKLENYATHIKNTYISKIFNFVDWLFIKKYYSIPNNLFSGVEVRYYWLVIFLI